MRIKTLENIIDWFLIIVFGIVEIIEIVKGDFIVCMIFWLSIKQILIHRTIKEHEEMHELERVDNFVNKHFK